MRTNGFEKEQGLWAGQNVQRNICKPFLNSCDNQGHIFSSVKPSELTNQDSPRVKICHIIGGAWEVTKSSVI